MIESMSNIPQRTWSDILARLKFLDFSRGEIKIFKDYFNGVEPDWDETGVEPDPIPLVFRLWLHPDQSEESWCRITEKFLAYRKRNFIHISLHESYRILSQFGDTHFFNGIDAPLGFFAGSDKKLAQFMMGETAAGARYTYNLDPKQPDKYEALYPPGSFGCFYYSDMCVWLGVADAFNRHSGCNPFLLGAYELERWRTFVENDTGEYADAIAKDERFERFIKQYFNTVLHYQGGDVEREQYCRRAREILDDCRNPPILEAWWREAKQAG